MYGYAIRAVTLSSMCKYIDISANIPYEATVSLKAMVTFVS